MGVVMTRPHPLAQAHLNNSAHPVTWKSHFKFHSGWLTNLGLPYLQIQKRGHFKRGGGGGGGGVGIIFY